MDNRGDCRLDGRNHPYRHLAPPMTRYWNAHSDLDWCDATHGYDAPEPITPEQEKLLAEEQERDLQDIDRERAREERRRVLEEAAQEIERFGAGSNYWAAYLIAAGRVRALIEKEPSRG